MKQTKFQEAKDEKKNSFQRHHTKSEEYIFTSQQQQQQQQALEDELSNHDLSSLSLENVPPSLAPLPIHNGLQLSPPESDNINESFLTSSTINNIFRGFHPEGGDSEPPVYRAMTVSLGDNNSDNSSDNGLMGSTHDSNDSYEQNFFSTTFPSSSALHNPLSSKQLHSSLNPKFSLITDSNSSNDSFDTIDEFPQPAPGGYLEPNYHFIINTSRPYDIMTSLYTLCSDNNIDIVDPSGQNQQKYRLKCVAYLSGAKLPFIITVFAYDNTTIQTSPLKRRFAVEFQRRQGCIVNFSAIYRKFKKDFESTGLLESSSSSSTTTSALSSSSSSSSSISSSTLMSKSSPIPSTTLPCIDQQPNPQHVKKTITNLLQMASSECTDIKSNALEAISELTADEKIQEIIIEEGCVDRLMSMLSHKHEDIARCSITSLANLTEKKREDVCNRLVSGGIVRSLIVLVKSDTAQIVRESSRLLSNLAVTLGKKLLDDDLPKILNVLLCSVDQATKSFADKISASTGQPTSSSVSKSGNFSHTVIHSHSQ